jgi:hypothetical protein
MYARLPTTSTGERPPDQAASSSTGPISKNTSPRQLIGLPRAGPAYQVLGPSQADLFLRRIPVFGRQRESGPLESVDLDQLCRNTVELTRGRGGGQAQQAGANVRVALELGDPPFAWGRIAELREVLTNLISNAVDAMPRGGTLTLHTWAHGE